LIATSRCSRVSRARCTSPPPPRPSGSIKDGGTRFEAWSELEVGRSNRRGRSARSEFLIDEALRSLRLLFVARRSCVDERVRRVGLQHRLDFASQLGVVARRFEERAAIGRGP